MESCASQLEAVLQSYKAGHLTMSEAVHKLYLVPVAHFGGWSDEQIRSAASSVQAQCFTRDLQLTPSTRAFLSYELLLETEKIEKICVYASTIGLTGEDWLSAFTFLFNTIEETEAKLFQVHWWPRMLYILTTYERGALLAQTRVYRNRTLQAVVSSCERAGDPVVYLQGGLNALNLDLLEFVREAQPLCPSASLRNRYGSIPAQLAIERMLAGRLTATRIEGEIISCCLRLNDWIGAEIVREAVLLRLARCAEFFPGQGGEFAEYLYLASFYDHDRLNLAATRNSAARMLAARQTVEQDREALASLGLRLEELVR